MKTLQNSQLTPSLRTSPSKKKTKSKRKLVFGENPKSRR